MGGTESGETEDPNTDPGTDPTGGKGSGGTGVQPVDKAKAAADRDKAQRDRIMGPRGREGKAGTPGASTIYSSVGLGPARGRVILGGNEYITADAPAPGNGDVEPLAVEIVAPKDDPKKPKGGDPTPWSLGKKLAVGIGTPTAATVVAVIIAGIVQGWFTGGAAGGGGGTVTDGPKGSDIVSNDNKPGSTVTIDVLASVTKSAYAALDPAGVTIVGADSPGKTLTVADQGVWKVDDSTGKISFTPDAKLKGDPDPISYQAKDTGGNQSAGARITIYYANTLVSSGNTPGAAVTVDIVPLIAPSARANVAKVVIVGDAVVAKEGKWSVGTDNKVTFTPDSDFLGSPTPALFEARDAKDAALGRVMVRVQYAYVIPLAKNDLIPGYSGLISGTIGGMPTAKPVIVPVLANDVAGTEPIDKGSVLIFDTMTMPGETAPKRTFDQVVKLADGTVIGARKVSVDTQGDWTVDASTGAITFTPGPGFTDTPTPIIYTVADSKGTRSNMAVVAVNSAIGEVEKALAAAAKQTDSDFWQAFKTRLIDTGETVDVIFLASLMLLGGAQRAVQDQGPGVYDQISQSFFGGAAFNNAYVRWAQAGFANSVLYSEIEAVTDATTGLGAVPLGTRIVRLNLLTRFGRRYLVELSNT